MTFSYEVKFRGFRACPCLAEWLPAFEAELLRRGVIKYNIDIFQLIGGAAASAGTHSTGGAFDIGQTQALAVWVARQMGADADWYRRKNWDGRGGMPHNHGVLRGCPHNGPARYQYSSTSVGVDHGHNGLANRAKDDGPRPLSMRTYKEGIAWAKAQGQPVTTPPAKPIVNTSFSIGYGNMFGPVPPYTVTALNRAVFDAQIRLIDQIGVSLFAMLECHEEQGANGMLAYFKTHAGPKKAVAEGKGGNHLLYDPKKYVLLKSENKNLGTRWASRWNLRRIDTGLAFWVVAFHTPAGMSPARVLARQRETKALLAWTANLGRVVFAIDKNNDTAFAGSPTKQLRDAGIKSLYDSVKVENSQYNSHHDKKDNGTHIDFLGAGSLAAFTDGVQVRTAGLSDHDWLKGDVTIKGVAG